ncbi:MAG: methyltransferase domain-containing protein [Deltaproteobacteria bacterium]|nr:methyltransferase domain-containing protein [Deltaproteobacteria bacterium]
MGSSDNKVVDTARQYYNSSDADNFYHCIWGGEDIHIGMYDHPEEDIAAASRRTVEMMAAKLAGLGPQSQVLDCGSGYGGAARYLARRFGCRVTALNLSAVENERHRRKNREQGLDHLITVVEGSFEDIPFPADTFDVAWSQDAILHSGNRGQVVAEVARVLKPGGEFIFTDPMRTDDCPQEVLQPILDRILLEDLGSPGFYRQAAGQAGLQESCFEAYTPQLVRHYARILEETEAREAEIREKVSEDYLARMKKGLGHWVDGGEKGHLTWGIFHFKTT